MSRKDRTMNLNKMTIQALRELAGEQAEQIRQLELCLDDILVVAADYDGYTTVEGLKKLVDRLVEIAESRKPEPCVDCNGNQTAERE